jgi:hypothetical protein
VINDINVNSNLLKYIQWFSDRALGQAENEGRVDQFEDGRERQEEGLGRPQLQTARNEISLRYSRTGFY